MSGDLGDLADVLPPGTSSAWERLVPVVPEWAYLSGGTALAVHLRHRVSRDLDFFTERTFDADALADELAGLGDFAPTLVDAGTINGVLGATKIQFLDASTQRVIEPPTRFAGLRIASLSDILATKVKVIGDRPALRDYFDLMAIEQHSDLRVEEGVRLYVEKYEEGRVRTSALPHILTALGYFGDVDEDPGLPVAREVVEQYWRERQPQVIAAVRY